MVEDMIRHLRGHIQYNGVSGNGRGLSGDLDLVGSCGYVPRGHRSDRHAGVGMSYATIIQILKRRVPSLLAIYAFGSRIQGMARPGSDLDLAVLVAGYADPLALFELAGELADVAGCPVDLLDLRAASTVMQYQIITTGERWWVRDAQAALFEAAIMSEKTELDTARSGLLADIQREGSVYGR
jgi:predicted nucleotidyltransferase